MDRKHFFAGGLVVEDIFLAVMKVCNKLELHRYVRNGTRDTHLSKSNRSSFQLLIAQTCNARPLRSYWFGSAAV